MRMLGACLIAILAAGSGAIARFGAVAEQCRAPMPATSTVPNIFSAEQERDLGDAVAEGFEGYLTVIENEALTAPLRTIADRLVAHLPQTGLQIRIQIVDSPEANAYALPGGRVYVTRKLIGLTRREDELATVIAHELGHLVTRQQSATMTRQLKEVLGVTALSDRKDVHDKYNQLMENAGRKPGLFQNDHRETAEQLEADRVGLFAATAAGYDPRAQADFWDRLTRSEGDTGGFLSRVFGTSSPDTRRLRDMVKGAAALPAGCAVAAVSDAPAYAAWQRALAVAPVSSQVEQLPGLVRQISLTPFRDRISHVRFSPDGRSVLVQDDSVIFVLDREPFTYRFSIPARRALPAEFSADSASVVFHTPDLRVERWSIATRALADVHDVHWPEFCLETAVSPDGKALACVDSKSQLTVIDTASGQPVFQQKNFYQVSPFELALHMVLAAGNSRLSGALSLSFSPSSQYLAAGYMAITGSGVVVYDLNSRKPVALKDSAKKLLAGSFAFIAGDRLLGLNPVDTRKSGIVKLPEGTVTETPLPPAALARSTQARYALVKPAGSQPIGLFDLEVMQAPIGVDALATDVFNGQYVIDSGAGDVGLFALDGHKQIAKAVLPPSPLVWVRTATVSPSLEWLVVSGATRGAVWNTNQPQGMAYMRDFDGSFVDNTGMLYADFPKAGAEARAVMQFNAKTRQVVGGFKLDASIGTQYGQWLVLSRPLAMDLLVATGAEYQVHDVSKPTPIWTRRFERDPPAGHWAESGSDALALAWEATSSGGRILIAKDERLKKTVDRRDLKGDIVLEVLDAPTGNVRGRVLVETGKGSFHVDGVLVRRDRMFVMDSLGRVLVYSLETGEVTGYAVGSGATASADGRFLALKNGEGRLAIYEVATMKRLASLRFKHDVIFGAFSPDGANLFALTADQTVHIIATGGK